MVQSQRVLTYTGTGTLRTWFEPDSLTRLVSSGLIESGWGVKNVSIINIPSLQAVTIINPLLLNYYNYHISVSVNSLANENPERVRQGLYANLSDYFNNVDLTLTQDTLETVNAIGQTVVSNTVQDNRPGIFDNIFGRDTTVTGAGAQILGLSTGTLIAVGLGFLLITSITGKRR